ncbi:MAG TPA: acyl-CoA thioesterase II [Parvularculaceae bacterium]|nr:acyl-CoA thioesterase II [Parvularculaceae bacterium]
MDASRPQPSAAELVDGLVRLLDVEELDVDLYRGSMLVDGRGRVFGGQVIAQGLMAATASVEEGRAAHSLHAYFLRPGAEGAPIIYRVLRDYDGGSFSNRRIVAMQKGQPILNMAASFHRPEQGFEHQEAMPDVPPPEDLPRQADLAAKYAADLPERIVRFLQRPRPIEMRPVGEWGPFLREKREPRHYAWFKVVAPIPDDPGLHRAILAYTSDMSLLGACLLPHGVSWATGEVQTASLDHAVWLHGDFRVDDWLLYATDSPWSGGARGFNRGRIFTRDGRLVADAAQEGLIRPRKRE